MFHVALGIHFVFCPLRCREAESSIFVWHIATVNCVNQFLHTRSRARVLCVNVNPRTIKASPAERAHVF